MNDDRIDSFRYTRQWDYDNAKTKKWLDEYQAAWREIAKPTSAHPTPPDYLSKGMGWQ